MRVAKKSVYLFAALLLAMSGCAGGEEAGAGEAANPCAANPCAVADTMQANPCNPCAANPCNPCATNPCNPCGGVN